MLKFIEKFFTKRPKAKVIQSTQSASSITAIRKGIKYDRELIQHLEEDHVLLFDLYTKIYSDGYEVSDDDSMRRYLEDFKSTFQGHLIKENVKFYNYLQQNLKDDPSSLDVVKDFRQDMNGIATLVVAFCKKYREPELEGNISKQFEIDYEEVGRLLVKRFQHEERDLYSLYGPPW